MANKENVERNLPAGTTVRYHIRDLDGELLTDCRAVLKREKGRAVWDDYGRVFTITGDKPVSLLTYEGRILAAPGATVSSRINLKRLKIYNPGEDKRDPYGGKNPYWNEN